MDITFEGKNYFIQRNEEETEKSLFNRMMFIAKQTPQNEIELMKETRFGNMWVNKKLLGCEYSKKLENVLAQKSEKL
jgi:hypothetical protein|tara:strand:- start:33 stop:263 length:231 start_codon:yes stop_codon:yes gene_type:complete